MREPKLGVAVGKKGVGKTYTTNIMMQRYVMGNPSQGIMPRRALIIDVNNEYEHIKAISPDDIARFSGHPIVEARRIAPFRNDGKKMTLNEIAEVLHKVLNEYRGGLLLIEDINRYISDNMPNDLIGAICTNRHIEVDIIIHYQSIGRISTKVWQNLNWLRFHKNTDSVDRHKDKFEDKYELFKIVENLVNNQYFDENNKRFYCYVDVDELKVMGMKKCAMWDKAVEDYINGESRSLIAKLLQQKDMTGKKKYTYQTAFEFQKNRIDGMYLP